VDVKVVGSALTCDEPDDRGVLPVWLGARDEELGVLLALHDAMSSRAASRDEQPAILGIKTPLDDVGVVEGVVGSSQRTARTRSNGNCARNLGRSDVVFAAVKQAEQGSSSGIRRAPRQALVRRTAGS
jgi:hypothetical protein